jgi:hypothetical protein
MIVNLKRPVQIKTFISEGPPYQQIVEFSLLKELLVCGALQDWSLSILTVMRRGSRGPNARPKAIHLQ